LKDRRIWRYAQSEANGPSFSLHIGRKVPVQYSKQLISSRFAGSLPRYEGEFTLFVEGYWRLKLANAQICSSDDSPALGGPIDRGLGGLVGRSIESAILRPNSLDLDIAITGGFVLELSSSESEVENCYDVSMPDYAFNVMAGGSLALTRRFSTHETAL
jgi:hypothetical protein